MNEHPIRFKGDMVRAILDGRNRLPVSCRRAGSRLSIRRAGWSAVGAGGLAG